MGLVWGAACGGGGGRHWQSSGDLGTRSRLRFSALSFASEGAKPGTGIPAQLHLDLISP